MKSDVPDSSNTRLKQYSREFDGTSKLKHETGKPHSSYVMTTQADMFDCLKRNTLNSRGFLSNAD